MTWEGLNPPYRTIVADPPWPMKEMVAHWLQASYSRSPTFTWERLSEASKNRWRRDATALLELVSAAAPGGTG